MYGFVSKLLLLKLVFCFTAFKILKLEPIAIELLLIFCSC